ncbi:exopolysaccharide biosynthesis polyprenyl glycosylphosphotransferase [Bradyrhizobium sp. 2TAF24]|uniref:exopolysaccharide biosynthesis polyprenyl glycosylphosphotransferase n=1 Tax=Bradyrhizobium sp. 2TAF24 TaxID=3233011 RepID=UPI003F8EC73F
MDRAPAVAPKPRPTGTYVLQRFYVPTLTAAYVTIALFESLAITAGALATAAYHASLHRPSGLAALYVIAAMFVGLSEIAIAAAFHQFNLIQQPTPHRYLWSGLASVLLTFVLLASLLFLGQFPQAYSREALLAQLTICCGVILAYRAIAHRRFKAAVADGTIHGRRIVLIGRQVHFPDYSRLLRFTGAGVQIIHCQIPPRDRSGRPCITAETIASALVDQCRTLQADDVILLADETRDSELSVITTSFREIPAAIYVIPRRTLSVWARAHLAEIAGVVAYSLEKAPLSATALAVKRGFDLAVSALAVLLLWPVMLAAAIAIKLDSDGPVLFAQERHGYNNQPIRVLKFRSMQVSRDAVFRQATRDDPRITRVGRWLRRTSIDELPQLFNILRGEMSLVGPRPHAVSHNEMFIPEIKLFSRRHNVKPGLTGWAQVNGYRGETDTLDKMIRRIECDLYYIDHWSLWFDLRILFLTVFSMKTYTNAG